MLRHVTRTVCARSAFMHILSSRTLPATYTVSRTLHTTPITPSPPKRLTAADLKPLIQSHCPQWSYTVDAKKRDTICRSYTFADFITCWSYMSAVALYAESHGHHPEWSNVYNQLHMVLTTHDCDGVSENDVNMAKFCEDMASKYGAK